MHLRVVGNPIPGRGPSAFREVLTFKAHRLVYHSTLGSRVIQKKNKVSADNLEFRKSSVSGG